MELVNFFEYLKKDNLPFLSVTIGDFDGIHLGHQKLLDETIKQANNELKTAVITFSPHPDVILKNKTGFELISLDEKRLLLEKWNFDYLIVIPFTKEFSCLAPKMFITDFLIKINVKKVIIGNDFSYGKGGVGKPQQISMYSDYQIDVTIIDELYYNNKKISSTDIRNYLINGSLEMAKKFLGRNYSFSGIVVKGKQIGTSIGLPTANIKVIDNFVKIKKGVYAVKIFIDDKEYYGMMNVGHNPTFNYSIQLSIEVNIFNFNQNIYGKNVIVECFKFIRDEILFDSKEAFLSQIDIDYQQICKYFHI